MAGRPWWKWGRVSDDLFVAPGSSASVLIYRGTGPHLRVKLSEIRPLIEVLAAAADALSSEEGPAPDLPRLDR